MSVSMSRVQLCSYCKTEGHKSDKCSCPSLLELLVGIIKFVNSLNLNIISQEQADEALLEFLNTKDQLQIKILARNLHLIPNMSISSDVSVNNLSIYILRERYIQNMRIEDDFIDRVNSRIGERTELMIEYRGLPILLQTLSLSRRKRYATIAYQHTIGRLTNNQINREFLRDLHIVQRNIRLYENFMETYSGLRYPIDNIIISKYYVKLWVRRIRYIQPRIPVNTETLTVAPIEHVAFQSPLHTYQPVEHHKVNVINVKTFVMPFECPICYEIPEDKCVITLCEHKYCNKCFNGISNMFRPDDGHSYCPLCRSVLIEALCCEVLTLNSTVVNELK
jgi:hypothetical protein